MLTTKRLSRRGRPRRFDPEQAVASAQRLFHARGYEGVSVADVTEVLGINPPSFYAAFGNKGGLYKRALDRYVDTCAIPLPELLRHNRPVAASLAALLEDAARRYVADPTTAGCLVLEGTRCNDPEAREAAQAFHRAAEDTIRRYIAARHPGEAERLTDFVSTVMAGMSAKAREGHSADQLLATARIASLAIARALLPEALSECP